MKRIALAMAIVALVFLGIEGSLFACEITFGPDEVVVGADGKGVVKAIIRWEHRKCELDDQDVNVEGKGLEILSKGKWKKVRRGLFENEIKVQLKGKTGSIRIWRECSLKGLSEGTIKVRRK